MDDCQLVSYSTSVICSSLLILARRPLPLWLTVVSLFLFQNLTSRVTLHEPVSTFPIPPLLSAHPNLSCTPTLAHGDLTPLVPTPHFQTATPHEPVSTFPTPPLLSAHLRLSSTPTLTYMVTPLLFRHLTSRQPHLMKQCQHLLLHLCHLLV